MSCKLGFIGVGKMGGAVLSGALAKEIFKPEQIGIYDPSPEQMEKYAEKGVVSFCNIESLVAGCDMVLLAVKPQNFSDIMPEVKKTATKETIIISIAAGITAEQIKKDIGFDCKIVLGMPNTPLLLGMGATALARVEPTTIEEFAEIKDIFGAVGIVEEVPQGKLNEVIPVHSSSPAFIYLMADTIVNHAETVGIDKTTAMNLFAQTLIGSAEMLRSSGYTAGELINMVCSPGGTTIAAMEALEEHGFSKSLNMAFEACVKRAEELSGLGNTPAKGIKIEVVDINSEYYPLILNMRNEILRKPIGLELSESDTEDDPQGVHFVALKDGKMAGTSQLLPLDVFNVQMRQMAVEPDCQKSGIGRLLISAMEDYAKQEGFSRITLNARKTAEGFYSALGYQCRGSYCNEKGIPHIAMYRDINAENDISE